MLDPMSLNAIYAGAMGKNVLVPGEPLKPEAKKEP